MRIFRTLLLAAAFTYAPAVYAAENDLKFDIDRYIDQANVLVGDENRDFCSGTVIDIEKRLVLTAYHCVADKYSREEREVVDPNTGEVVKKTFEKKLDMMVSKNVTKDFERVARQSFLARIWRGDKENDVAILEVVDPAWKPEYAAKLASDDHKIHRGDRVYIVGNPGIELDNSVTQGIVSATERTLLLDGKKWRVFQTDAQAIGGNSGGSVLDEQGDIIGTLSAGMRGTSITFVIPISATKKLLEGEKPVAATGPGVKGPIGHSFFVKPTADGFTREIEPLEYDVAVPSWRAILLRVMGR